jgi:hypothetical protein
MMARRDFARRSRDDGAQLVQLLRRLAEADRQMPRERLELVCASHGEQRSTATTNKPASTVARQQKGSRPTKPARASQKGRSQAAHRPIAPTRACSALLGHSSHRDSTRMTHRPGKTPRGRDTAADADVELRETQDEPNAQTCGPRRRKSGAGSSHTNLSGGSCMHALQKRKSTTHHANRRHTTGGRPQAGNAAAYAPAPHCQSYSDRGDFQEEFANDF